jgi:cytoskeletal protein CcmA (bactofilin family)
MKTKSRKSFPPSIISADMKLEGNIKSENELHIDGSVKADIDCRILYVGVNGFIEGKIMAEKVFIEGTINGTLTADAVNLSKTARIIGDIYHKNLSIETGAYIDGICHHQDSVD